MRPHSAILTCLAPRPMATGRLVVVPWAGGGASAFRKWAPSLSQSIELWGVQLPGHEGRLREEPPRSLREGADELARALRGWTVPFVLFGHSLGAWIAYEALSALAREGGSQARGLVASGMRAPQVGPGPGPSLSCLPDDRLLEELHRRFGGAGPDLRTAPEVVEAIIPILRADVRMLEGYQFEEGPPLKLPIFVLRGSDDPFTSSQGRLEAWAKLTKAKGEIRTLQGGHFFPFEGDGSFLPTLGSIVGDCFAAPSNEPEP